MSQHPVHLGPLPIYSLGSLTGSGILGTVPLDGPTKAMLGTATAMKSLFVHQSLPTQLPIIIYQSFAETETRAWNLIHMLRPYRYFIHLSVALCEGACRYATLHYHQITNL